MDYQSCVKFSWPHPILKKIIETLFPLWMCKKQMLSSLVGVDTLWQNHCFALFQQMFFKNAWKILKIKKRADQKKGVQVESLVKIK